MLLFLFKTGHLKSGPLAISCPFPIANPNNLKTGQYVFLEIDDTKISIS